MENAPSAEYLLSLTVRCRADNTVAAQRLIKPLSAVISLAAKKYDYSPYNQKPPYKFTEDDFEIYNRL